MELHNLKSTETRKSRKRIGRGQGSGRGGTSTKGHKGAKSRSGFKYRAWFEGGQMPLYRRIPKFGFKSRNRVEYTVINLDQLQKFFDDDNATQLINHDFLIGKGYIPNNKSLVKVLGRGNLSATLVVELNKFSDSAKAAIEGAGGNTKEV